MLDLARHYVAAGLSVISIRADGSKAPELQTWKQFQTERPTDAQLREWFGRPGERGIAILGGIASGGLEILDFDEADAWVKWRSLALLLLAEAKERVPRLPLVRTPSGGMHCYYRHSGDQQGNQKLACAVRGGKTVTIAEDRGRNGYVLAPGCPSACHPSGRTYELLQGDLGAIPAISGAQRDLLLDAARALNEVAEPEEASRPRPAGHPNGARPGDVYNARADWESLLRRHGWRKVGQRGATGLWRRPGKQHGASATTNYSGSGYLIVFSTNAPPFRPGRAYSLFGAYGLLEHGGDYAAAATACYGAGYRDPVPAGATVRQGLPVRPADSRAARAELCQEGPWWRS